MREKIDYQIKKYRQFSYTVLGKNTEFDNRTVEADVKNYAKHILQNGTRDEKRGLLNCLKSTINLKNKVIFLMPNKSSSLNN